MVLSHRSANVQVPLASMSLCHRGCVICTKAAVIHETYHEQKFVESPEEVLWSLPHKRHGKRIHPEHVQLEATVCFEKKFLR